MFVLWASSKWLKKAKGFQCSSPHPFEIPKPPTSLVERTLETWHEHHRLSHSSKHVRRRFKEIHEKFLGTKHPRWDAEKLPRLWASWLGTWLTWSISSGSLLLGFFKLRPAMLLKQRQGGCSGWIQAFVNVSFWPSHSHTKMTETWRGFWLYIWFPYKSLCRRLCTYALQLNFQGQTPPKKRQKIWALKPAGCKAFP